MAHEEPLPSLDVWSRPFWESCRRKELRMQKCCGCGSFWFPPGPVCPDCRGRKWEWRRLSGRGRIWSWVVFHHLYFPAFADRIPYNVVAVRLQEGPFLLSNLVGVSNEEIDFDMPVEVVFEEAASGFVLPKFRPAGLSEPGEA